MSSVRTDSEGMAGRTGRLRIEPLEERILMSAAALSAVGKISEGLFERDAERVRGDESRFPAERDRGFHAPPEPPPPGVAVQISPGDILVIDRDTLGEPDTPNSLRGAALLIDPLTGEQQVLSMDGPFLGPQDGTFSDEGVFYVVDRSAFQSGAVFVVNLFTGQRHVLTAGGFLENPRTVLYDDASDMLLVVDPFANPMDFADASGAIIGVDPVTGEQTLLLASDMTYEPVGLVAEPGGTFLIIDQLGAETPEGYPGGGRVLRWDPVTGDVEVVAEGGLLVRPREGEIGPDGALYVADWGSDPLNPGEYTNQTGSIIRIDLETGEQTLVAGGGNFMEPWNLTFAPDGTLLVADKGENNPSPNRGVLHAVDPATGAQQILSSGGVFYQPVSVQIVPEWYPELILAVETATAGERTQFAIDGAIPGATVALFVSFDGPGSTTVDGVTLGLENAELVTTFQANASGHIGSSVWTPGALASQTVWVQAVSIAPGQPAEVSAVIERPVSG